MPVNTSKTRSCGAVVVASLLKDHMSETVAAQLPESANICPSVIQSKVAVAFGLNFGRCVYSWLYIDFVMYT